MKQDKDGVFVSREAAPGYGNDERTMPFVETDDPEMIEWLKKDGWQVRPEMESLRTADEILFEERAARQGSIQSQMMAQSFGAELARMARENISQARTSKSE
jgi:hypothetical protein